jgi:hypothetical protein
MRRARYLRNVGALALAAPALVVSFVALAADVRATSVCEINAHQKNFEGHWVSLFARVKSVPHDTLLVDERCPQTSIKLRLPPYDKQFGEVKRLGEVLPSIFAEPRLVKGRFTGRLVHYPGNPKDPLEDLPHLFLELHDVGELSVEKVR